MLEFTLAMIEDAAYEAAMDRADNAQHYLPVCPAVDLYEEAGDDDTDL